MSRRRSVVIDCKLKPVMRLFCKGYCDRRIARVLDRLARLQKLVPCGVRSGNVHARRFAYLLIDKQPFPVAVKRYGIAYAVRRGSRRLQHGIFHIGSIIGIDLADLVDGNDLARLHERIGIVAVKVKQYVRLRPRLEVRNNPCLKRLVRCGRGIIYHAARLIHPCLHRILIIQDV